MVKNIIAGKIGNNNMINTQQGLYIVNSVGYFIDEGLTWRNRANHVFSKVAKSVGMLKVASPYICCVKFLSLRFIHLSDLIYVMQYLSGEILLILICFLLMYYMTKESKLFKILPPFSFIVCSRDSLTSVRKLRSRRRVNKQ